MTFAEIVREAATRLGAGGASRDAARIDADVLARHVLGWDQATWLVRQRETASAAFRAAFEALIERRLQHEPVAYITGGREFYGRPFVVSSSVLVPRPETELVVERALTALQELDSRIGRAPVVVDVGTGSGCIAVTLALEAPRADVIATDISGDALAVARTNAEQLGASHRVRFVETSLLAGIAAADIVVSNPPYIADSDRQILQADVVDYEPSVALFGGHAGLDIIRRLAEEASRILAPGGWLIFEFGNGQEQDIVDAIAAAAPSLAVVDVANDLAGIPRVLIARQSFDVRIIAR